MQAVDNGSLDCHLIYAAEQQTCCSGIVTGRGNPNQHIGHPCGLSSTGCS